MNSLKSLSLKLVIAALLLISLVLVSCESFGDFANFAADAGFLSDSQADAAQAIQKAFEDLTPEQEYYVGRTVAASILDTYPALDNTSANAYLNSLGQSLALASDNPYTFKGYRFILLDSDDINAFATPGGFILMTRGMLECAPDEGALAAVLAHEIGHVQLNHGIKAIKSSRWTDAITKTAIAGAEMSGGELAEVTKAFGGSIEDITKTLVVSGYSKDQEREADKFAAELLSSVGYDPADIIRMLKEMDERWDPNADDFAATHPSPDERIRKVSSTVEDLPSPSIRNNPARDRRYASAFAGI